MEKMTVKEAYEDIANNCFVACTMDTTCDDFAKMDEESKIKLAKEYAEWFNNHFRR